MPHSNRSDARRRALRVSVPALVLVVAATGCVKPKPPGVKIADLESSIVFGLKPLPVAAPPGAAAPPIQGTPSNDVPTALGLPEADELPPLPVVRPTPPTPAAPFCRTATVSDFPTTAPQGAPDPPKPGTYYFKKTPPELFGTDRYNVGPLDLQARTITNVSKPTTTQNLVNGAPAPVGSGQTVTTTTYQYDQYTFLDASGKSALVDRYKVVDNPIYQSAGAVNFGPTEYAGQPDRGLTLQSRQVVTPSGSALFVPSSPLLLLPLPAVGGQTWQSVSTDPASGATYILYGRIIERLRVDACGDVIEGWAVEAQTVFKDPRAQTSQNANFRYYVDTANGAQIIYEKVEPIRAPANPVNGTPADAAVPPSPEGPSTPISAPASEWSLARRNPQQVK